MNVTYTVFQGCIWSSAYILWLLKGGWRENHHDLWNVFLGLDRSAEILIRLSLETHAGEDALTSCDIIKSCLRLRLI